MNHETSRSEQVELADQTIADLAGDADIVGGKPAIFSRPCVQTDDDATCGPGGECWVPEPVCNPTGDPCWD